MAVARRWKCGVCSAKAGDLVCSRCVTQEAERRRVERAERLGALRAVRDAAAVAMQERQGAVQREAQLQKETADEYHLKEQVREVTKRVAEERIKVASAAFALKHHRDLLAAAESQLTREQMSAAEMKEALLDGLRRHSEDAARTLEQRRWRKVVQLFVLLPVAPSIPMSSRSPAARRSGRSEEFELGGGGGGGGGDGSVGDGGGDGGGGGRQGSVGRGGRYGEEGSSSKRGAGSVGVGAAATVSGVSTLVDLPLPNNGDYNQVPADVLMAALAVLVRLLVGVASCLGVSLPHPLFPAASTRYAAISVDSSPRERSSQYPLCPPSKMAEIGVMGATSSVCNTVGAFETALDLLRSDVVHLCVEGAKVPVDRLWPAEALLLNLWELQQHAISELRSSSPVVDVPVPMPRDPPKRADGDQQSMLGRGRLSSAAFNDNSHRPGGGAGGGGGGAANRDWVPGQSGQDARQAPSSLDPTSAAAPGGAAEDEEATYEFVVGDGVVESGNGGAAGRSWSSWGSRLAATGSGGRLT